MLHPLFIAAALGKTQSIKLTLSGALIINVISGFADLEFRTDGTVWSNAFAGWNQISVATDWIIPNGRASSSYDIRYTNLVGDALFSAPAAQNVWIAMSANRKYSQSGSAPLGKNSTFDIEMRLAAVTLDTGEYQLIASTL